MNLYQLIVENDNICISQEDYNKLAEIFNQYKIPISPETIFESKNQQFDFKKFCFTVPFSSINTNVELIKRHFEVFDTRIHKMINWYKDTHSFIMSELGESEGVLFLMILATTSSMTDVIKNMVVALKIFDDIKYDLANNSAQFIKFIKFAEDIRLGSKSFGHTNQLPKEFQKLKLFDYLKEGIVFGGRTYIYNIIRMVHFYLDNNQNITIEKAIKWLLSGFQYEKQSLEPNVIRGFKLFNFTINLLDPEFNIVGKENMFKYSTIDRHMIRFVIPQARDKNNYNDIAQKVFANDQGLYFILIDFMNEIRSKLAKQQIALSNSELQAVAWYVAIKNYSREQADFKSYLDVLKTLNKIIVKEENMAQNTFLTLKQIIEKSRGNHNLYKAKDMFNNADQMKLF